MGISEKFLYIAIQSDCYGQLQKLFLTAMLYVLFFRLDRRKFCLYAVRKIFGYPISVQFNSVFATCAGWCTVVE